MKRLHSLDALRGFAALGVVVWHWQHFFALDGRWPGHWDPTVQPLYGLLKPLYGQGWVAVDLFFALSGFVFFWLYGEAIRERRMGALKFAVLRFSRLYPLHFATLIAVMFLQAAYQSRTGTFFVYQANDLRQFLLSLFFVQQWAPPTSDLGFNGPSWSVSVEVLLYIVFFGFCRLGLWRSWQAVPAVLLGLAIFHWNMPVARGLIGFFIGGIAFRATEAIRARADAPRIAKRICLAALAAWAVVAVETYWGPFDADLKIFAGAFADPLAAKYAGDLVLFGFLLIVSPLTIMALALHEMVLGASYRRLSFFGDISYAAYMLHFPLQLTVALLAVRFGISTAPFLSGVTLGAFLAVLIGLAALSYKYFERPLQRALRDDTRPARRIAA